MGRELVGTPVAGAEGREAGMAPAPRRALQVLSAASALGGLGQSLAGTAGALLAWEVGGSASVAGLPQACLVAGAAGSALALSRLTVRRGRRVALSTGTAVAVLGCLVVAGGAASASFLLVLFGSGLLGAGSTAVMLGRYAAADLGPEVSRARMMATVLMATTFGAVAGPNLLAPASGLAAGLGLPPLAGPYLVAAVSFSAAAGTLAVGLRPRATPSRTAAAGGIPRSSLARSIPWSRSGLAGLVVLGVANLVMVSVMTMTPVRMGAVGSGLPAIGLVVSLHVAGMFGPSPFSSWLTERIGAAPAAGCAGAVLIVACSLAAFAHPWPALAATMALLGIGWNLSLVSGSTLLTADVPSAQRPHREGRGELAMGVAAAGGGAAAGPVMAGGGYWLLATGAAAVAALVLPVIRTATHNAHHRRAGQLSTANRRRPTMALPRVVSREEWLTARKAFLVEEKEFTRARDALSAARRALPMVAVDEQYGFDGPQGAARLLDLFEGRRQLVVYHFMFDPGWDEGCPMCSFLVDNMPNLTHLREARDTSVVVVSRAPLDKITAFKQRMGWTLPWYSSSSSDFNYDFHVTLDDAVSPVEYNYRDKATMEHAGQTWDLAGEQPGVSVFLRDGEHVFHTYSTYQRGPDLLLGTYNYLDLTPLGRQEDGPGSHEFRHHDRYATAPRGAK